MFPTATILLVFLITRVLSTNIITNEIKLFEKTNTNCKDGWVRYFGTANKCIKVFNDSKNFEYALEYCQLFKNGTLVSIHNIFQNMQVATHCQDSNNYSCLIGLYNFEPSSGNKWTDGSAFDYTPSVPLWIPVPYEFSILGMNIYSWSSGPISDAIPFICMQDL